MDGSGKQRCTGPRGTRVLVIYLAHNEERNISRALADCRRVLLGAGIPHRFIVVDDGSTDGTAAVLASLRETAPLRVVTHAARRGVGAAFASGFRAATEEAGADVVVTMEADGTNVPDPLVRMVALIAGGCDVVCASRYRTGGGYRRFPLFRKLVSCSANRILRLLFPVRGVRDYTIFYRAYSGELLRRAVARYGDGLITAGGFSSNAEILVRIGALGIRCAEVPFVYDYGLKRSGSKMAVLRTVREYVAVIAMLLAERRRKA